MSRNYPLFGLAIVTIASAADVGYFNSSSCIEPSGILSCYGRADSSYTKCVDKNCKDRNAECINACGCLRSTDYINCAASNCWNQVYGCEYQLTVSDYINACIEPDLTTIPYWPPPENAPLGCSCPIGNVQLSILSDVAHLDPCLKNQTNLDGLLTSGDIANYEEACTCCYQSGILSAIYDICPFTIPSIMGADTYFETLFIDTDWEMCGVYLAAYDCNTELGFSSPARNVTNYYRPEKFPKNGTLGLFDTKGEGEIKTPVSGNVFTWTANGVARTVSAVGVTSSSGGASVTVAQTGTRTGAVASSTQTKTSGASILGVGLARLFAVCALMFLF